MGQSPLCNPNAPAGYQEDTEFVAIKQQSALLTQQPSPLLPFGALCAGETWVKQCRGTGCLCGDGEFPDRPSEQPSASKVVQECCVQNGPFDSNSQANWQRDREGVLFQAAPTIDAVPSLSTPTLSDPVTAANGVGSDFVIARKRLLAPHKQHRFNDLYQLGSKIGEGSFGDVFEACSLEGGQRVAVKIFTPKTATEVRDKDKASPRASPRPATPRKEKRSFEAEIAMLAILDHPNLVKMIECFEEDDRLYIVMELCRGGELYARMVRANQAGRLGEDEDTSRILFRQMLRAVGYLHGQGVTHRDLKTENFLLLGEPNSSEGNVLKLCDFGAAVRLEPGQRSMEKTGTLSYTAPEVYLNKGACAASDSWALGVVLYVVLTGTNPFRLPEHSREDTVKLIQTGQFETRRASWQRLSEAAKDVVCRLLVLKEDLRLTPHQALSHPWFNSHARTVSPRQINTATSREKRYADVARCMPSLLNVLQKLDGLLPLQKSALVTVARFTSELELIHRQKQSHVPWYDIFTLLDEDKDGVLNCEEFAQGFVAILAACKDFRVEEVMQQMDCNPRRFWSLLDADQSGFVEWTEWLVLALLHEHPDSFQEVAPISTAFRLLDRPSSDGLLTVADLMEVASDQAGGAGGAVVGEAALRRLVTHAICSVAPKASSAFENAMRQVSCSFCEEQLATKLCRQCSAVICEECILTSHSSGYFTSHRLEELLPSSAVGAQQYPHVAVSLEDFRSAVLAAVTNLPIRFSPSAPSVT